ncbi:YiiG family protein [Tepidibacter hydrothermalis]|uniref:YiiG family protein n=1 Tax=Tepidibacter hydrothermalis TaxID=3036126 RepID=A0ABY8EDB7_9FIRM|nr:YiiG family protein [Tepidibacter hydrothermalis]WFD10927.1 YiiG family protein [Tepidibacter hydrothermalis]
MFKKNVSYILICVIMCTLLSACSVSDTLQGSSSKIDTEKYNSYITLSNYMTGWLDQGLTMYFKEFGIEEQIKIDKNFDSFQTMPILQGHKDDVEACIEYASKKPSFGAADDSVKALCPKLKELMNTLNEIQNYYSTKSFVDDDFAKGKELHKKIYTQYNEYVALAETFFSELSVITEQKNKEDLESLKKSDYMIRYHAMSIVMRAQDIQMAFYEAKVNDSNILDFDVNKYKEKYDLLTEDINKFMEYSKDDERLKKEGLEANPFIGNFESDVERMKVTATDIMEILKTKDTSINSDTKGKVTTGGRNAPLNTFNTKLSSVINSYNNMN